MDLLDLKKDMSLWKFCEIFQVDTSFIFASNSFDSSYYEPSLSKSFREMFENWAPFKRKLAAMYFLESHGYGEIQPSPDDVEIILSAISNWLIHVAQFHLSEIHGNEKVEIRDSHVNYLQIMRFLLNLISAELSDFEDNFVEGAPRDNPEQFWASLSDFPFAMGLIKDKIYELDWVTLNSFHFYTIIRRLYSITTTYSKEMAFKYGESLSLLIEIEAIQLGLENFSFEVQASIVRGE